MATYGMMNVVIKQTKWNGDGEMFFVYADTERFGKHEIMYQCYSLELTEGWLAENGVTDYRYDKSVTDRQPVSEMVEAELEKPFGKIQIGNVMYRRLRRESDGSIWGHSGKNGLCQLDRYINGAVKTGNLTAKTAIGDRWIHSFTIKFGNACTW